MKRVLWSAIIALTACASAATFQTQSGNPEVLLLNTTPAEAKTHLVHGLVERGFIVTRTDDVAVEAQKKLTDYWHEGGTLRERYTIVQEGPHTRIVGTVGVEHVANGGESDDTHSETGQTMQAFLTRLRAEGSH